MKKSLLTRTFFCFLLCFSVFLFSCGKAVPSNGADHEILSTSGKSQTVNTPAETTRYANPFYEYTVPANTEPLRGEPLDIQQKLDALHGMVPSKVILQIGEVRDVPYLLTMYGKICNTHVDGYAVLGNKADKIRKEMENFPVYRVKGDEELFLYSNDKRVYTDTLHIFVLPEDEPIESGSYFTYELSLSEAAERFGKGRHIAYVPVKCEGDVIMNVQGERLGREYMDYSAFFIIEVE